MITFDDAKRIALDKIGPDCALIDSATLAKPYGWYFVGQSRKYLETGDRQHALFGSGGFIVERANGRIFDFGSRPSPDQWIANYERGLKYDRYDLTVLTVSDLKKTIDFLHQLSMQLVIPELENSVTWMIPSPFTAARLREMLHKLPCTFSNQAFWHRAQVFDQIDESKCCTWQLREHQPRTS